MWKEILKARDIHEEREHGIESNNEKATPEPKVQETKERKEKPTDDRYSYATQRLGMGLFLKTFDDAVKEGDSMRHIQSRKFGLLFVKSFNHSKYALEALQLLKQMPMLC